MVEVSRQTLLVVVAALLAVVSGPACARHGRDRAPRGSRATELLELSDGEAARLLVLEHHSARQAGLLTERTRRELFRARHGATRHVAADAPGELVCLDTFY